MSIDTFPPFTLEFRTRMQEAVESARSGQRDSEALRQSCEQMDRIREEICVAQGTLNIGIDAIRELRDAE